MKWHWFAYAGTLACMVSLLALSPLAISLAEDSAKVEARENDEHDEDCDEEKEADDDADEKEEEAENAPSAEEMSAEEAHNIVAEFNEKLSRPITIDNSEIELANLIGFVAEQLEVTILFDPIGLDEAGVTRDQIVSHHLPNMTAKSALRHILRPLNLVCIYRDEALVVTSAERETLNTVVYNVRDIAEAQPGASENDPVRYDEGPLVSIITTQVSPDSWREAGGRGSVNGFRGTLVVTQTAEIQEEIAKLLHDLRETLNQ